jgi:galactokinase/galacturonokinase
MEYGKFNETNLREVPYEVFLKYKEQLPLNFRKRAEHFYDENKRVEDGVKAYRNGDIEKFGKLVTESGYSSIYKWETGSEELKTLYELLKDCKGVYGTRFSGAGFKGCTLALIDPEYAEEVQEEVGKAYVKKYPSLKDKYSSHICHTADGVKL